MTPISTTSAVTPFTARTRVLPRGETRDSPRISTTSSEGNNTSGSHKLNSAVPQAYMSKNRGLKGVTTETGAGQWGTARFYGVFLFRAGLQSIHG